MLVLQSENIVVGQDATATIRITNSNAIDETYSFVSANNSIATVNQNGVVTGHNVGTTTISIVGDTSGQTKDVTVTVNSI